MNYKRDRDLIDRPIFHKTLNASPSGGRRPFAARVFVRTCDFALALIHPERHRAHHENVS